MFGIGEGELMIILVFGFLLFGPDKLPQMGHTIGRALRQFRETQEKMTTVVQTEIVDPMAEAVNGPVKPKKTATVDADDDADVEVKSEAPAKKETFAERRARLAAEKAAKEAEASTDSAAAAADTDDSDAEPASEPAATADAPAEEPAETPAAEPEPEPAVTTTEDLYARRPRKRKKEKIASIAAELEAAQADDAPADAAPAEGGDE